jgi:hypothetical protein
VLLQLHDFRGRRLVPRLHRANLSVSATSPLTCSAPNPSRFSLSVFLYKGTDSSFLSAFFDVLTGIILCGMTIIAALMITLGFMVWCQNVTLRFPSCELAAGQAIDKQDGINTANFYIELGTAQFGVWGSFATWVGLSVFALLKLCRYHQLENIRVSMYRERQRLINENAGSPGSSLGRESTNSQDTTATAAE